MPKATVVKPVVSTIKKLPVKGTKKLTDEEFLAANVRTTSNIDDNDDDNSVYLSYISNGDVDIFRFSCCTPQFCCGIRDLGCIEEYLADYTISGRDIKITQKLLQPYADKSVSDFLKNTPGSLITSTVVLNLTPTFEQALINNGFSLIAQWVNKATGSQNTLLTYGLVK